MPAWAHHRLVMLLKTFCSDVITFSRDDFFALPCASVVVNAGIAFGLVGASRNLQEEDVLDLQPSECRACVFIFTGDASDASALLSIVSGAAIQIATLTFSLTVLSVQLASVNYSPRLLEEFMKDPIAKWSFAINLGAYVYCVVVQWNTYASTEDFEGFVPYVAVNFVIIHVFLVILFFIFFVQYFLDTLRLEAILKRASDSAKAAVHSLENFDDSEGSSRQFEVPIGALRILADASGYVRSWNFDGIIGEVCQSDLKVQFECFTGEFVTRETLLAWAWKEDNDTEFWTEEKKKQVQQLVNRGVLLSKSRARENDVTLGVQQLADIAVRALSPGTNDPETAIQAMDSLSVVFAHLVISTFQPIVKMDPENQAIVRISARLRAFSFLLNLCMDPIRSYGLKDANVARRAIEFLGDLGEIAMRYSNSERLRAIRSQTMQWTNGIERTFGENSMELENLRELIKQREKSIRRADAEFMTREEGEEQQKQVEKEEKGEAEEEQSKGI